MMSLLSPTTGYRSVPRESQSLKLSLERTPWLDETIAQTRRDDYLHVIPVLSKVAVPETRQVPLLTGLARRHSANFQ